MLVTLHVRFPLSIELENKNWRLSTVYNVELEGP